MNEEPDRLDDLAYEMAIEHIAKMYKDLRSAGLERQDAAVIVAQILNSKGDV